VTEALQAGIGRLERTGALLHLAFEPQGLGLKAGHQPAAFLIGHHNEQGDELDIDDQPLHGHQVEPVEALNAASSHVEGNPELDNREQANNHRNTERLEPEGRHHQERQDHHHRRRPQQRNRPPLDQGPAEEHTSQKQPPVPTAEVLELLPAAGIQAGQHQRGHREQPNHATEGGGHASKTSRNHTGQHGGQHPTEPAGEQEHQQLRQGMEDIALVQPAGSQQHHEWVQTQQTADGERARHRLVQQRPQHRAQPEARHHGPTPAERKGADQARGQPDRRHSIDRGGLTDPEQQHNTDRSRYVPQQRHVAEHQDSGQDRSRPRLAPQPG